MFDVNSLGQIAREREENVRLQIWIGIVVFLLGIGTMWLVNITELRFFNILVVIVAMAAIALVGSKTKTLVGFSLAGVIVHLLQGKSLPEGVLTGLGWLLNLLVAVAFVFALSAFVLTSLNYATAPGSFWVLALGSLTGVLTHLFFKDSSSGVKTAIMVFVFIVIAVASFQPVKATMSEYFGVTAKKEAVVHKTAYLPKAVVKPAPTETMPIGSPTEMEVPSCLSGTWARVNIPKGWRVNLAWNEKAAGYQWRSVKTGQWEKSPAGGADAVRFCALFEPYAGDLMPITWQRI